jgi:hypothetical protein
MDLTLMETLGSTIMDACTQAENIKALGVARGPCANRLRLVDPAPSVPGFRESVQAIDLALVKACVQALKAGVDDT